MTHWVDRALEDLAEQYNRGDISDKEFREAEREIMDELRGEAEENAERAYNDTMGL